MVICKYFQNGYCRFGSKCVNEHFDVKQYIKTQVEAALKGSQWPLSCFGLFKACIPNFIEDQSFEEVRLLCYNAKKENCFPAYQQQFTQQVMEAQNKMKTLLSLRREVVDAMIKLYDDAETAQEGGNAQVQGATGTSNPFSLSSSALSQPNTGGLFGSSSPSQVNSYQGQGFGGGGGGGLLAMSSFGNHNFGGGSTQTSIFGGQPQQTNAFSFSQGAQPSATAPQGGNIFSMGAQQQQPASTASIIGGTMQQPQQQQQQGLFGSTNLFGGNTVQPQTNLFGQVVASQQQQQQQQPIFGQSPQGQNGFGAFGQQPQAGPGNLFGVQQQTGIFGQQQQQQPAPTGNLFGSPQQNLFGQQQQQQPQQQPTNAPAGIFGEQQGQQQNASGGLFNMGQQQQIPGGGFFGASTLAQQSGNIFGQAAPNAFQQTMPQQQQNVQATLMLSDTVYSKMEDLTPEEIEAFKAPEFVLGKIPTKPPPRELI